MARRIASQLKQQWKSSCKRIILDSWCCCRLTSLTKLPRESLVMTKYKESLRHFLKAQKVKSQSIGPQQQGKKQKTSNMFKSLSFCLNFSDIVDPHTDRLNESITVGQVECVSVSYCCFGLALLECLFCGILLFLLLPWK